MDTVLKSSVKNYRDQAESWKQDHKNAMKCRDLEELIANGIFLFERISRLDERIHRLFFKKEYNREVEEDLRQLYQSWGEPTKKHLEAIAGFENEGYEVEGANELRKCYSEVIGILSADSEFFACSGDLAERALKQHSRGETTEFKEMGE